jgi:hypothetical protein
MQTLARQYPDVAFFAHPTMGGAARIAPGLLIGKLFRLLGADAVIFPNHGGRFGYTPETCRSLAEQARMAWHGMRPSVPVPAGGMTLDRVPEMLDFYGPDAMLLIGGSLLAGARSADRETAVSPARWRNTCIGDRMDIEQQTPFRAFRDYRWDEVACLPYKEDGAAPFKAISRQVLFAEAQLGCELRYFEMAAGGYSTLERHEHMHAVMILRGHGRCCRRGGPRGEAVRSRHDPVLDLAPAPRHRRRAAWLPLHGERAARPAAVADRAGACCAEGEPGGRWLSDRPVLMGRSDGLDALAQRVRFDLACLNHPPANWVVPAMHPSGDPVSDVVVIGAGMAGLVLTFSLLRNGIRNIRCLDRGTAGVEGPWVTYARMETLRSPKVLTGPAAGIPSLTFRAWFVAQFGAAEWQALDKIPCVMWMDYLRWYREVLALPVENGIEVLRIAPLDGLLALGLAGGARILARKVVMATGREGLGRQRIPASARRAAPVEVEGRLPGFPPCAADACS